MAKTKDAKKTKLKKMPEYRGMERVTKKKHKEAVDGLVNVLREAMGVDAATEVEVYGRLTEVVSVHPGKEHRFNVWKIAEICTSRTTVAENGSRSVGGCSWMASDADCAPLVYAAEKYLESFYEPVRKSKDTEEIMFDPKGEAELDLRYLWGMPSAEKMREVLTYLHWRASVPPVLITDAFNEKMFGQYGDTVGKIVGKVAESNGPELSKLIARFTKGNPQLFPQPPEAPCPASPEPPSDSSAPSTSSM